MHAWAERALCCCLLRGAGPASYGVLCVLRCTCTCASWWLCGACVLASWLLLLATSCNCACLLSRTELLPCSPLQFPAFRRPILAATRNSTCTCSISIDACDHEHLCTCGTPPRLEGVVTRQPHGRPMPHASAQWRGHRPRAPPHLAEPPPARRCRAQPGPDCGGIPLSLPCRPLCLSSTLLWASSDILYSINTRVCSMSPTCMPPRLRIATPRGGPRMRVTVTCVMTLSLRLWALPVASGPWLCTSSWTFGRPAAAQLPVWTRLSPASLPRPHHAQASAPPGSFTLWQHAIAPVSELTS
jgi:hypothetical protein